MDAYCLDIHTLKKRPPKDWVLHDVWVQKYGPKQIKGKLKVWVVRQTDRKYALTHLVNGDESQLFDTAEDAQVECDRLNQVSLIMDS